MSANLALTIPDPQKRNRRKVGVPFLRVRTTPELCISALLETGAASDAKNNGIHCDLLGIGGTSC